MSVSFAVPVPFNTPGGVQFVHQGEVIWIGLQLITLAVALAFLAWGFGARLRTSLGRLTGGKDQLTLVLFAWIYLAANTAAALPLRWADVARWAQWAGQGAQVPEAGAWLWGQAIGLGLLCAAAAGLLWIPNSLMAKSPRLWWLWLTAIAVPVLATGLVFWQVVLLPMTTRFEPLADAGLTARIEAIAERCGAGTVPIFVGGNDETVVGLGPTSRILIPPWALKLQTPDQVVSGVAHEMKHYRMGDNWLAIGSVGALVLAGGLLAQLLGHAALRLWGSRMGVGSLNDPAAFPLLVLILALAWTLAGLPIFNAVQKHAEHEADRFALEATRDNLAFSESQAAVGRQPWRMNEEDWITRVFFDTHPSQAARVRFGNSYRPWEHGQPGVYDRVCRPAA
jgi:STE24 endopeptidase